MWVGLTLTQPLPRRPAAYGDAPSLMTTPSWPAATRSSKNCCAATGSVVTSRGTRRWGARAESTSWRSSAVASTRSRPSACRTSKRKVVRGTSSRSRSTPTELAVRDPVTWNGAGRPPSSMTMASPSRTRSPPGSAATASRTSGSRSVTSSRLRVKIVTSPSRRCTWTRMPSSLPSTSSGPSAIDPSASSVVFADPASIGRSGRPTTSPTSSRAACPPRAAISATTWVNPASMTALRTTASGTADAFATAARTTPSRAP